MRTMPVMAGLVAGLTLGLGGVVVADLVSEHASAQGGFTVTPGQLQTNQRISQVATLRGNQSLNLLAPLREAGSKVDLSDRGTITQQPGTGGGWTTSQIADGAITEPKLAEGVAVSGPPGPPGPTGPPGPPGAPGAPGATNVVVRTIEPCPALPMNVHCSMPVQCLPGERAVSGGGGFTDFAGTEFVNASYPLAGGTRAEEGDTPTGWFTGVEYTSGGPRTAVGYVVCASP